MKTSSAADVVVVGAGPAGAVTAALLARRGLDVRLLDRSHFPRPKPCGESLNPGAVRELAEIGVLDTVLALPHAVLRRWRVHPLHGEAFEGEFPAGTFGVAVDRGDLDAALLEFAREAGAHVTTGYRVTGVIGRNGAVSGVRGEDGREIGARVVVGADGLRSVVVRRLGLLRRMPRLRKLALTAHVSGAEAPSATGILRLTRWGCIGIAPLGDGVANVVVVLHGEHTRLASGDPGGCFDRLIEATPYLRDAARVCDVRATGPFDWPTRSIVTDGAVLVGDAAGYFDPLTGQGIYRAVRGARLAADVLTPLLGAGRLTAVDLAAYQRRHDAEFRTGERIQRLIEVGVAHPLLFSGTGAMLRVRPSWANRALAATGDVLPVRLPFGAPTRTEPHPNSSLAG